MRHRDRFVAKEELLDALWPGVSVSETALTTAVKAIRRALGDDGERERFIETKRGRGYRWVAAVRERLDAQRIGASSDEFVGREDALATLAAALDAALAGRGSVVLVRGEAGIGKTRLLAELAARLDVRRIPRAAAWCAEESAAPPFWPWRQLLRRLDETQRLPPLPAAREAVRPLLVDAEPAGGDDGLDL